jgi:hypothetical protein
MHVRLFLSHQVIAIIRSPEASAQQVALLIRKGRGMVLLFRKRFE